MLVEQNPNIPPLLALVCSDEVKKAFESGCYTINSVLMAQLSLDIRSLTEAVRSLDRELWEHREGRHDR